MALEFNTQLNSILQKTGRAIKYLLAYKDSVRDYVVDKENRPYATVTGTIGRASFSGYRRWKSGRIEYWGDFSFPANSTKHDYSMTFALPQEKPAPSTYKVWITPHVTANNDISKLHSFGPLVSINTSEFGAMIYMDYPGAPTRYDFYISGYVQE